MFVGFAHATCVDVLAECAPVCAGLAEDELQWDLWYFQTFVPSSEETAEPFSEMSVHATFRSEALEEDVEFVSELNRNTACSEIIQLG